MRAVKHLTTTAKAPDKTGTFDGAILYNPTEGDSDGERVANFINTPTTVPLDFQHLIVMDPGSVIGQIKAVEVGDGKTLAVHGELTIGSKMADAVHERMLLTDEDPMVLKELSVAYAYDPSMNTKDDNGVVAIHDAELLAISVVHAGAQPTRVMNVKSELDVLEKTALAGLISVEQAMKYAEDLGIPGDISQKLFESSATVDTKYMGTEPPAGSYEERQEDLREALQSYAGKDGWAYVVATYADRVVACIETPSDDKTLQFPYAYDGETVTLGAPTEVEVEMLIVAAAKAAAEKQRDTAEEAEVAKTGEAHVDVVVDSITINGKTMTVGEAREYLRTDAVEITGEGNVIDGIEAEKAGRVIGAKRVSDLKSSLGSAIDAWAAVVNGDLAEKTEQVTDLLDDDAKARAAEIEELNGQLDALVADQKAADEAAAAEKAAEEAADAAVASIAEEVSAKEAEAEKARQEEIESFRLRLDAI